VLDLAKAGRARLETLTGLAVQHRQQSSTEAVNEIRYPAEFSPPTGTGASAAVIENETRNVGAFLEVEPFLHPDGRTASLQLEPSFVSFLGFRNFHGFRKDTAIPKPQIESRKVMSGIEMAVNEPYFLGTISGPPRRTGKHSEKVSVVRLAFLHLNIAPPDGSQVKVAAKSADWSVVTLEYRIYSTNQEDGREVLLSSKDPVAPWEKLQAALAAKKVQSEHVILLKTKPGKSAHVEEIEEVRYGVAFDTPPPPEAPETRKRTVVTDTYEASVRTSSTTTTEETTARRPVVGGESNPSFVPLFELRNIGMTVEAEPVVDSDKVSIELQHVIQRVAYLGDLEVDGVSAQTLPQPLFESRKITTAQTLVAGQQTLVGTFNPPAPILPTSEPAKPERTWLVFVRATPNEP
jgi:hypothetical protein